MNQQVKAFTNVLMTDLKGRYTGDLLLFLTKVTMLDPRFKGLRFLSHDDRDQVVLNLKEDIFNR